MCKTLMRENPIVVRSRSALIAVADGLLDQRSAAEISIKDVVEAAGMSRPTFYQHFTDLGSLFSAAGLTRLKAMFSDIDLTDSSKLTDTLRAIMKYMEEDAQFYSRVHQSSGGAAFNAGAIDLTATWLRQLPSLSSLDDENDIWWEFLAAGVVWTINRHLAAYCRNPEASNAYREINLERIFALLDHRLA